MKFTRLFLALNCIVLFCACSPDPSTDTVADTVVTSPLAELLAPTLASAIDSAQGAIDTALAKADYSDTAMLSLASLQTNLMQLKAANKALINRQASAEHISRLGTIGDEIQQLRAKIDVEIISLKNTNAAAAIRLGVVNGLSGFCALTALDIHQAQRPTSFN